MEKEKDPVDLKKLWLEGKEKGEGMSGISPRFIMNALNIALGAAKDGAGCINPVDVIRALKHQFDHHIGFTDEEKSRYIDLLMAEKGSVLAEYRQQAPRRRSTTRSSLPTRTRRRRCSTTTCATPPPSA